jgi:invasion protein IalB
MLWIYIENDTFFGRALSKRMHQAYTEAGGNAEYHLLPPFGSEGHFLIDSPDRGAVGRAVPRQTLMKTVPTTRWRREMTEQRRRRSLGRSSLLGAMPILLLLDLGMAGANAQQPAKPEGSPPSEKSAGQEFAPRGQRAAREIKYSDWRKTCFKAHGTDMACRTSIAGTFETGQSAVRIDLIECEGEKAARLQLLLPVGLYLQAGVRLTIDQGATYRIPYMWCLTTPASQPMWPIQNCTGKWKQA